MRKIIFIFVVFFLVSFSKDLEIKTVKFFSACGENDNEHLKILENEQGKMNEIYNKLIQKFNKNGRHHSKLKQKLINSQKIWIKYSDEEMRNYGMYRNWYNLCVREKSETREQINLIQQRILELTNEYKKYLD
ncbi:lysozyme inhibitor LprI family protein [Leptotrichia massiliensis]